MLPRTAGAREAPAAAARPLAPWAFSGVAVASFGGPLALAALAVPATVAGAGDSTGLASLSSAVLFTVPLVIWLRYARHINGSSGLYGFVEAAAGRRVALAQAALWIVSYALYLVYTTVQIVYDILPAAVPAERHYQPLLALLIPVALTATMVAGRSTAMIVIGLIAAGQLVLAGILDAVTLVHVSTPASSFTAAAPAGSVARAGAQTSLLYVCGSLPLFLGGELVAPTRTIRRGLIGSFLVAAGVVVLAVAPLASLPGLLRTDIPGVAVAQQFAGAGLATAIGIGVAVSTAGVILCEYLALTRLVHSIGGWSLRRVAAGIGAVMVATAPFTLIDPEGFYNAVAEPSLVALWLSQLVVFAVYPLFARRYRQRTWPAWILSGAATGWAIYGLSTAVHSAGG